MVVGCGIDIEEILRFRKHTDNKGYISPLIKDIFTENEIKINLAFQNQYCFPLGFTCKEAVFKAFGCSWTNSGLFWKDIELIFRDKGDIAKHDIVLSGFSKELFQKNNCKKIESDFEYNENYVLFSIILLA